MKTVIDIESVLKGFKDRLKTTPKIKQNLQVERMFTDIRKTECVLTRRVRTDNMILAIRRGHV